MFDMQVTATGPLFDGRATKALDDFIDEAEEHVADEGVNRVKAQLGQVLRNPTGFYESRIVTDRQRDDMQVHDSGVIYGPWLAGTSSRNQTTSFKGYDHWRRATQELDTDAANIAQQVLPKYLDRMNR